MRTHFQGLADGGIFGNAGVLLFPPRGIFSQTHLRYSNASVLLIQTIDKMVMITFAKTVFKRMEHFVPAWCTMQPQPRIYRLETRLRDILSSSGMKKMPSSFTTVSETVFAGLQNPHLDLLSESAEMKLST